MAKKKVLIVVSAPKGSQKNKLFSDLIQKVQAGLAWAVELSTPINSAPQEEFHLFLAQEHQIGIITLGDAKLKLNILLDSLVGIGCTAIVVSSGGTDEVENQIKGLIQKGYSRFDVEAGDSNDLPQILDALRTEAKVIS